MRKGSANDGNGQLYESIVMTRGLRVVMKEPDFSLFETIILVKMYRCFFSRMVVASPDAFSFFVHHSWSVYAIIFDPLVEEVTISSHMFNLVAVLASKNLFVSDLFNVIRVSFITSTTIRGRT